MKAIPIVVSLLLALSWLTGCQREDLDEPLKLSGKVFIFNYRVAQATYVVTLARNGPLPDPSFVETTFENPAGGAPLVTRTKIFPFWEKVSLESPPVHCVIKDRPYAVSIRILDASDKVQQTIETTLTSSLDQTVMPGKALVVGPVYTPNPEVYGADGTVDYAKGQTCPAA
ncbi:hypothetical protein [Peteryoungia algae]|uniref:DUF4249 family protein n=1 Tax=Peteryoungia algae TaxID=2919917 RepID=A0ABT0D2N6_9HYPH|nr:hypothetical protein [Rhizobium sp. SSM4.3]MCJ8239677.1 hypothetical protein [Rhizobium sp. SSM4.3]